MSAVTTIDFRLNPVSAPFLAVHGGTDALGQPAHDFSTNANAVGPCPELVARLRAVDATHYPDPHYTDLVRQLAAHEGVRPEQIVPTASASEAITRITAAVRLLHGNAQVFVPPQAYGDYARAAAAWQLTRTPNPAQAQLIWQCEPSSPTGQLAQELPALLAALGPAQTLVLDLAYAPLRLDGADAWLAAGQAPAPNAQGACPADAVPTAQPLSGGNAPPAPSSRDCPDGAQPPLAQVALNGPLASLCAAASQRGRVWRMVTPNKALGLTGIRAAYLIAPDSACHSGSLAAQLLQHLQRLAPSWPVGSHGVCLLQAWCDPAVQAWLSASKELLRQWRARQVDRLQRMGWRVQPSMAPFGLAQPPVPADQLPALLQFFRVRGVKLRDAESLGAPGWLRLGVRSPADQVELEAAWQAWAQRCSSALLDTPVPLSGPVPVRKPAEPC